MQKALYALVVASAVGAGGHYALRYYMRSEVRKQLSESKGFQMALSLDQTLRQATNGAFNLNLPSVEALVESVVPLHSFVSPYDAADDIGQNGRMSKYWPKAYKKGSINPVVERDILRIFGNIAASGKKKQLGG